MLNYPTNRISVLFFYLAASASFIITLFSSVLVPSQFTRDSELYANRISSAVTGYDDTYQVVANFYQFFGITQNNLTLRILAWFLFFGIISIALRIRNVTFLNTSTFFASSIYFLLIPFYGSVLTKETFIGIFLIPYFLFKNAYPKSNSFLVPILLMLVYAIFLRNYYFITLSFFFFYKIAGSRLRPGIIRALSPIILLGIIATLEARLGVLSKIGQGDVFNIRMKIQMGLKFAANSRINQDRSNSSLFQNIENYIQIWMQLVFPYNLLQLSLYSFATFVIVVYISMTFTLPFIRARSFMPVEVLFLFSYFVVALIFEPDLGSYVRHSFPFLTFVARNSQVAPIPKNPSSRAN